MSNALRSLDLNSASMTAGALGFVDVLIRDLGGNPERLFAEAGIAYGALSHPEAKVSFDSYSALLELGASRLACPSFGLQLAKLQRGRSALGPLEVAMQNSGTLGDAYALCAAYSHAYSPVVGLTLDKEKGGSRSFIRYDIRLLGAERHRQLIEYVMAWVHASILNLSRDRARAAEIWLVHEPVGPLRGYRAFFGTKVLFSKPMNAVFLSAADMKLPLRERDMLLYELARSYVESHYPGATDSIRLLVRNAIQKLLAEQGCSHIDVAETLGMHPRALQRQLYNEGTTFEKVKDEVRRELVVRLLAQRSVPLTQVAAAVGYSEVAVLCRSCKRWFGETPRRIRLSPHSARRWLEPVHSGMVGNIKSLAPMINDIVRSPV